MKVFKYPLRLVDTDLLPIPVGAKFLHVAMQNGKPYLWAAVDETKPTPPHKIHICGTGHDRPEIKPESYIGTFMMAGESLVWHVFDGGEQ